MMERRQHLRTPIQGQVALTHPVHGTLVAPLRDVSHGGVFVVTGGRMPLLPGEEVQVQARELEDAPVLRARVMRVEQDGVGLMFCDEPA
jgi:hypothetical protein